MAERISKLVIKTPNSGTKASEQLTVRGYVSTIRSREVMDAMLVSATGFEGPKLTVTGGDASYGGSVFTGITPNNREYVVTLRPMGQSLNDIKNQVNRLIGLSHRSELILELNTVTEEGGESRVYTSGYISDVSAPLFSDKREIVITFISPMPYLQRDPMSILGIHDIEMSTPAVGGRIDIHRKPSDEEDKAFSAPSTFRLALSIPGTIANLITTAIVSDEVNSFSGAVKTSSLFQDVSPASHGYLIFDMEDRAMYLDANDGMGPYRNPFVGTNTSDYPSVYPNQTGLSVSLLYSNTTTNNNSFLKTKVDSYLIYPKVYGI